MSQPPSEDSENPIGKPDTTRPDTTKNSSETHCGDYAPIKVGNRWSYERRGGVSQGRVPPYSASSWSNHYSFEILKVEAPKVIVGYKGRFNTSESLSHSVASVRSIDVDTILTLTDDSNRVYFDPPFPSLRFPFFHDNHFVEMSIKSTMPEYREKIILDRTTCELSISGSTGNMSYSYLFKKDIGLIMYGERISGNGWGGSDSVFLVESFIQH